MIFSKKSLASIISTVMLTACMSESDIKEAKDDIDCYQQAYDKCDDQGNDQGDDQGGSDKDKPTTLKIEPEHSFKSSDYTFTGYLNHESGSHNVNFETEIIEPMNAGVQVSVTSDGKLTVSAPKYTETIKLKITMSSADNRNVDSVSSLVDVRLGQINTLPLDFFSEDQWHLNNTGQSHNAFTGGTTGFDINLNLLHEQGVTGEGIEVAIIDDGVELAHPDLASNIKAGGSLNFINNTNDPSPDRSDLESNPTPTGSHGTAVAGLVGADSKNAHGGRGVSPSAILTANNYIAQQSLSAFMQSNGVGMTANASVINHSYGISAPVLMPYEAAKSEIGFIDEHYAKSEKPALSIKAAGNGFDRVGLVERVENSYFNHLLPMHSANSEPLANSFFYTVVGALSPSRVTPKASYSSTGSNLLISAPGGEDGDYYPAMLTTDVSGCDAGYSYEDENFSIHGVIQWGNQLVTDCAYTAAFNGTSGAAPVVSGVAALLFQVNPELTWRDVRWIMAHTANPINEPYLGFIEDPGIQGKIKAFLNTRTNSARLSFHNNFGFGAVDAQKAVQMATSGYTTLPALKEKVIAAAESKAIAIPETASGVTFNINNDDDNMIIEGVQVKFALNHSRPSDVMVKLVSPSGMESIVLSPRNGHVFNPSEVFGSIEQPHYVLLSNAFLGEKTKGNWRIEVVDTSTINIANPYFGQFDGAPETIVNNATLGSVSDVSLRFYGHNQ